MIKQCGICCWNSFLLLLKQVSTEIAEINLPHSKFSLVGRCRCASSRVCAISFLWVSARPSLVSGKDFQCSPVIVWVNPFHKESTGSRKTHLQSCTSKASYAYQNVHVQFSLKARGLQNPYLFRSRGRGWEFHQD